MENIRYLTMEDLTRAASALEGMLTDADTGGCAIIAITEAPGALEGGADDA